VKCEFEILFPKFSGTELIHCPYLSRDFRLREGSPGLNDTLLLLSCAPVGERGNAQVDSIVRQIRHAHPGIEAVFVALNEMEYIFMSAFKRGAPSEEEWHQPWLDALKSGRQPVSAAPFCQDTVSRVRVTSEGNVFFCCFQRALPIGNLLQDSFETVWSSKLAKDIRFATQNGFIHKACQKSSCPHAYRHRTRTEGGYVEPDWPIYLDIDPPNSHCNIGGNRPDERNPACIMCERSLPGYRFEEDRAKEVLPKLKQLMPHIRYLHIQGVAEAFWKELIFDYLEQLEFHKYKSDVTVTTYSNGIAFDKRKQMRWLEATENTSITFSLDAANPETYQKIRRLPAFDRVVENIRTYSELVRGYAGAHRFQITNNINTINVGEVSQMVELGASLGASEIAFDVTGGQPREIIIGKDNEHLFIRAEGEIRATAQRLSQKIVWVRPFRWAGS
jgi:molybdenum cofactor biosynthesis enzyme MoaA